MATITYERPMIIGQKEAEIIVEMLDRPAVPLSEETRKRHEENLRRGKEWMKQFSNTPQ
ncbi:MAG: hypothetical protein FWG64_14000 [Firmicutes bacterium]|nr:hypothetical protein [Bacillota bacterium]